MRLRMNAMLRGATLGGVLLLTACGGGGSGGDATPRDGSECVWGQSSWNDCDWAE